MKLNAAWHQLNPMPTHPTMDQRIDWHLEHARQCACRGIPSKLIDEMRKRQLVIPEPQSAIGASKELNFDALESSSPKVKYGFARDILKIALSTPRVLYPHFDKWIALLEGSDHILKWMALDVLGRLAVVDEEGKIVAEIPRLLEILHAGDLVASNHAITALGRIADSVPAQRATILHELMKVEQDQFETQECLEIVIGKVIEVLSHFLADAKNFPDARQFVQRACASSRKATAKKGHRLRKILSKAA